MLNTVQSKASIKFCRKLQKTAVANSDPHKAWGCGPRITHTSKVISNTFLGICRICVSPNSPEMQIHGLAVNMEPPSFLLGTIRMW